MGGRSLAGVSAAYDYRDALTRNVHAAANAVERSVIVAWNNYEATTAAIAARQQQIAASEVALEGVREKIISARAPIWMCWTPNRICWMRALRLCRPSAINGWRPMRFVEHGTFDRCAPRY